MSLNASQSNVDVGFRVWKLLLQALGLPRDGQLRKR
jgi:hypothetical protein